MSTSESENTVQQDTNESRRNAEIDARLEARRKEFEDQRRGKKKEESEDNDNTTEAITVKSQVRTLDEEDEANDTGVIFDKKKYPKISAAEYTRYWDNIGAKRSTHIMELAKKTSQVIPLYTARNAILDDPNTDLTEETRDEAEIKIEQKEFRFHDATTAQWDMMQEIDADLQQARDLSAQALKEAAKAGRALTRAELDDIKTSLRLKERAKYRYGAKIFYRMLGDEIDRADQRRLKDAVDAAIHRTIVTIPNYSKISNEHFT